MSVTSEDLRVVDLINERDPRKLKASERRVLEFAKDIGYNLTQTNGQRRFGPPVNWSGNEPTRGCEVFVGKLPRDCYEDELFRAFSRIGKIFDVRVMLEFCGRNRGYSFVKFQRFEDAKRCTFLMNDTELRPGVKIGVTESVDNCRLYMAGIDETKTAEEIKHELSKCVDGVSQVIMYPSITDKSKNRGFVFVEFETHRLAAMARKRFVPGPSTLGGERITVDWAEPEPIIDPKIMSKIRKLYIRNLHLSTTEDDLRAILYEITAAVNVLRVKKIRDFAFLHFRTRASAELVHERLRGTTIQGCRIDITWAKPPNFSKDKFIPDNIALCTSLPPRLRRLNKDRKQQRDDRSETSCSAMSSSTRSLHLWDNRSVRDNSSRRSSPRHSSSPTRSEWSVMNEKDDVDGNNNVDEELDRYANLNGVKMTPVAYVVKETFPPTQDYRQRSCEEIKMVNRLIVEKMQRNAYNGLNYSVANKLASTGPVAYSGLTEPMLAWLHQNEAYQDVWIELNLSMLTINDLIRIWKLDVDGTMF